MPTTDLDMQIERLKSEATKRWGERWVVKVSHFADGDTQAHALTSRGRNEDGHLVQDYLIILDSGEVVVERVTSQRRELNAETIEAPTTDLNSAHNDKIDIDKGSRKNQDNQDSQGN